MSVTYKLNSFSLPPNLKEISTHLLHKCFNIGEIKIHNNIEEIKNYALAETGIININIPDNVKMLGECVFLKCNSLTNIKLPNNLVKLNMALFYSCNNLKYIHIPSSINKIEEYVFYNCGIETISLPNKFKNYEKILFQKCINYHRLKINYF